MSRQHIWAMLTVSVSIFSGHGLHAAEDAFTDMPVVLSANTLEPSPARTPVTISSIGRKLIEASGARTIPDALRLIPGVYVGHSVNDFGDKPLYVVAYHGHSDQFSRQMNVLIDGRSIYDPLQGGVNWYNIPVSVDDIERIEVTRGPNATTYGSNSFLAVINIITRHASEDQGHFVKLNAGNHDIFDATYRYGGQSEDLDYRVTLATVNDDGQDRADGGDASDDLGAGVIDYRLDFQLDSRNLLTWQGGYGLTEQNTDRTNRTFEDEPLQRPRRVIEDTTAHQFLRLDSTIDDRQSFVVKYFFNYLDEANDYFTAPIDLTVFNPALAGTDPMAVAIESSYTSKRHNLEFTHFITASDSLNFAWGISGQNDHIRSEYYFNPGNEASRTTWRLFGNVIWDINDRNTIDIGVLAEKADDTDRSISPRVTWIFSPSKQHTFRAGYSRAVRNPFILEQDGEVFLSQEITVGGSGTGLYAEDYILLNQNDLRSERITSIELGYYGKYLQDDMSVNIRLFQDELDGLIFSPHVATTATPDIEGLAFIYDNLFATRVRGLEVELDYRLTRDTRLFTSGALIGITSRDDPRTGKSREYEESAPDTSLSLLAMHDFNELYSGSLGFYYVGDMSWMDVNNAGVSGRRNTGGYEKLDLRLLRHFRFGRDRVSTAIVLQNLLGEYSDYDAIQNGSDPVVVQNLVAFFELKVSMQ